jgi:hypothetical protein|tara:strand:+ start:44 stop:217 length:174 start_codon:yes stop_codon:yes gene_type:complete
MPYSKYSPKQKKLAALAPPRKKITKADLMKARKRGGKAIARKRPIKVKPKRILRKKE